MPVEQPRARVSLGGVELGGVVELEVEAAGLYQAGRYRLVCAASAASLLPLAIDGGAPVPILLEIGADGFGFAPLLSGLVETVRFDLARGVAVLQGRDETALLIDTEISQSFVNQTASDVALAVAQAHGLAANVTPTQTLIGQYYQIDHARSALTVGARASTQWSLLCGLAEVAGFAVSVVNGTLNFGPMLDGTTRMVTARNFLGLEVDLITALPASVTVRSWNCRDKKVVTQAAGSGKATNLVRPNLTTQQAGEYASAYLQNVQRHAQLLLGRMPGDASYAVGDTLLLSGTQTALDGSYQVAALQWRLNDRDGFVQSLKAYGVA